MQTSIFLHASKESNSELGEELGLKGEALNKFRYACYEVELTVDVNEETGKATIIAVDGKKVEQ